MKKILIVFGTRPEAIKMAPVVRELQKYPDKFTVLVCVTGQHREMLDQVLNIFEIQPDIDLNIMRPNQDLTDVTIQVLSGMRSILKQSKPDLVLVHGDTTTSIAAALAAFYQQIPVGHIEAGLRTYDINNPWPEEINRQLTGRIATWHFAPTEFNNINLLREGISAKKIFITGNTVIDALYMILKKISSTPRIRQNIETDLINKGLPADLIKTWNGNEGARRMVLITGHRRENFGEGFRNICMAIRQLVNDFKDVDFVYPVHLNPNVREPVKRLLRKQGEEDYNNLFLVEPLNYLAFVFLLKKCCITLTDSGGIQEEAPGLGKPVLVMRDETERPEGVKAGTTKLIGTNQQKIVFEVSQLLKDKDYYRLVSKHTNPYGDGNSRKRIMKEISNILKV